MSRAPRIVLALGALATLALALGGCGSSFKLPTEVRAGRHTAGSQTYQMLDTWKAMNGVNDILLTQGRGSQLFILFNHDDGVTHTAAPRGAVTAYPLLGGLDKNTSIPTPITSITFPTLFNPIALCSGGGRVFVLDGGDTCLARANPLPGAACDDTVGGWGRQITNLSLYWRVREYGLLGGDTLSTFSDTTLAFVRGIAADAQGRVYVSGIAIILVLDPNDPFQHIKTRLFQSRIYRYLRGGGDSNMPGAAWHRDPSWMVEEGSGVGTVMDAHGLFWSGAGGDALYAADWGKNWIQKLSDTQTSTGFYQLDGGQTGRTFNGPFDVTVDLQGYVYLADTGNQRVLRYDPFGTYIQTVNIERDADGDTLWLPVTVAANDSIVYVGDHQTGKVIHYKRRI